jgi:hypothetical protein
VHRTGTRRSSCFAKQAPGHGYGNQHLFGAWLWQPAFVCGQIVLDVKLQAQSIHIFFCGQILLNVELDALGD